MGGKLRHAGWIPAGFLAALTAAVAAAVIIAGNEKPSRVLEAAAPSILRASQGTAPEIAAINEQVAQIAALNADALYGPGMSQVVRGPVPALRPILGERWRELSKPVGRVFVRPIGTHARYFQVGMVVVSEHGSARLALQTSEGEQVIEGVGKGVRLINIGPLLAPRGLGVGLALTTLQPQGNGVGPNLVISPIQGKYLVAGEWVTVMPALAEIGPGGLRGTYLASGSTKPFAMTPGITGRCTVTLQAATFGGPLQVSVTVGSEVRSAVVGTRLAAVHVGPFSRTSRQLSVSVGTSQRTPSASLFIGDLRFVRG